MILHEVLSPEIKNKAWEKFRTHHYSPDSWNPAARVFLATEMFDDTEAIVGMSAALAAPSGSVRNAWCSHKVVILPPRSRSGVWSFPEAIILPDFDKNLLWRALADVQAKFFVENGHRYFCNASDAPPELVAYRDDPASGWIPTSKNGHPPRDKGHKAKYGNKPRATNAAGLVVSHWFVGLTKIEETERQNS